MRYFFGDTQSDKTAIKQLEDLLYAPGASGNIDNCKTNLAKAQTIVASLTSESARKDAQYYINEFRGNCSKIDSSPNKMYFSAGIILVLVVLFLFFKSR